MWYASKFIYLLTDFSPLQFYEQCTMIPVNNDLSVHLIGFIWCTLFLFKSSLSSLQHCFWIMFCFTGREACETLAPDQESNPHPCTGRWSLNPWTTREVPCLLFCNSLFKSGSNSLYTLRFVDTPLKFLLIYKSLSLFLAHLFLPVEEIGSFVPYNFP